MNPEQARQIADTVVRDTQFWIALIGIVGGIVGALIALLSSIVLHWLQGRKANALDRDRKKLLKELLDARDWRKLSTLSRVIGADEETTRRLLIELGARGSETVGNAGEVWGLISKHPLARIE
jgi:hypothetical protein